MLLTQQDQLIHQSNNKMLKSKGNKEMYKFYRKKCREKKITPQNDTMYRLLLSECNQMIVNIITDECDEFKIPYRQGVLRIRKRKRKFSKLCMDYKKSKDLNEKIFYTDDWKYKPFWDKKTAVFKNQTFYRFKACRALNRYIKVCVKDKKLDYFE